MKKEIQIYMLDRAERHLRKEKEKRVEKSKENNLKGIINGVLSKEDKDMEGEITKTLAYEIKPISVEDAKMKLEEKGDMFLPFVNVETNEVNVLYKRGDGSYGMVIPE